MRLENYCERIQPLCKDDNEFRSKIIEFAVTDVNNQTGRKGPGLTYSRASSGFTWGWFRSRRVIVVVSAGWGEGPRPARCITLVVPAGGAIDARVAHARRTFAAVALADEPPQQVGAMMAVGGLVEGLLGEGVGAMGRGRGLRHGGRTGRAGRARYSCRGAQGRAALSERLSRPTIAARLPPAPHAPRARANRPRTARAAPRAAPRLPLARAHGARTQ
ncbi:hypothetical protein RR48_03656 [Papilio machaon]|uniref:Uncharacterized protein n=1 Tax=Papilio machaon TaxID=76193 RepID=A0A0N1IEG6_PAPMA|nr:hypothetical protein RR48_03656 [Papilio machaon]